MFGAVHEGDEGGDAVEDRAHREFVDGETGRGVVGELFDAGHAGTEPSPRRSGAAVCAAVCSVRAAARRCVPGSRALQRVKFTVGKASC